jgi:DICT domain-containing protein
MDAPDKITDTEQKIKGLEQELNDLRQGLTLVADYYRDLQKMSKQQEAVEAVDEILARPLVDEDLEFEGIWKFHEDALIADPDARVPFDVMYNAFVQYCQKNGRSVVDHDAFEFVFAHIENPAPVPDKGDWTGYRLRPGTT